MKKLYKFTGVTYIEGTSEDDAKNQFCENSMDFAADADCIEVDNYETAQEKLDELLQAIKSNTESANIPDEFGRDNYVPVVRLQYIIDEM